MLFLVHSTKPTIKFQIFCVVWATVGTFPYKYWYATVISAVMWLTIMNCLRATYIDQNQRAFLAQIMSFVVRYDFIYDFFPISSQYLMMWGVDSPAIGQVITCPARKSTHPILMEWTFFKPWGPWRCAGIYMYLTNDEYKIIWGNYTKVSGKNFLINLIVYTNTHYYSTMILYLPVHLLSNFH